MSEKFERLVQEAITQEFFGWDFSWAVGRWEEGDPSWDYPAVVQARMAAVRSMLDMDTGGGEFLASLENLPEKTYATEAYPPNIPLAKERLEPLGVQVLALEQEGDLPLPNESLELVINRHGYYRMKEVHRVLKSNGIFLTQQVGGLNAIQLNEFLEAPSREYCELDWSFEGEVEQIIKAGFEILRAEEEFLPSVFYDIGAVVFYLKIIEWQIPNFTLAEFRQRLLALHQVIENEGAFHAKAHRFLIEARKKFLPQVNNLWEVLVSLKNTSGLLRLFRDGGLFFGEAEVEFLFHLDLAP